MTALFLAALLAFVGLAQVRGRGGFVELLLIGCNDDFNSRRSNLAELLAHDPDVIFIQEGKAAHYRDLRETENDRTSRRLLPFHTWGVHQDTSSPDRAGTVVIYRHDLVSRTASGFTFGVKAAGLLTRWIAWVRGSIGTTVKVKVFLFSAHRPPLRARRWWHPFDLALWARLRGALAAGRVVLGQMDSNEHGGPPSVPRGLKVVDKGNAIDVFVLSRSVEVVEGPTALPKGSSDHHPYKLRVRIPVSGRNAA